MSYQGFPDWDKLTCDGIQIGIQDLQKTLMTSKFSDSSVRAAYEQQIEIGKGYFQKVCNIPQLPYGRPPDPFGYGEGYGYEQQINKCKGDFRVECNDGTCDVTNGAVAPCLTRGGVKGITSVNPVEKVVEAIKPKTEEEEYRNFIYLAMVGIGVYLILSE